MSTHVYTFGGKFYLQKDGGPIGLTSTACLAALVMKLLDMAWVKVVVIQAIVIKYTTMTF